MTSFVSEDPAIHRVALGRRNVSLGLLSSHRKLIINEACSIHVSAGPEVLAGGRHVAN